MKDKRNTILICFGAGMILGIEIFTFSHFWKLFASTFTKEKLLMYFYTTGRLPSIPAILPASLELPVILMGLSLIVIGVMSKISERDKSKV